ncbi:MAG: class I SAM-dependent methyltransferase [bacterium]
MKDKYNRNLFKWQKKLIDNFSLSSRRKKLQQFYKYFSPQKNDLILDVGVGEDELCYSDNLLEKEYLYPERIVVVGIDENLYKLKKRYPKVRIIICDGKNLPFKDLTFDIAYSNAVIEHVGDHISQQLFLKEIMRVSSKGAFITTPNKYFPIEFHTNILLLHFLPQKYFDWVVKLFKLDWATGDYMNLLSFKKFKDLFPNSCNVKILKNKILGFTATFTAICKKI